ncbi:MAG: N-acetyltransferase [Methanobrevibacter sp.]|nr:N-acetyltransferase [Methanobrevibacter sp.]
MIIRLEKEKDYLKVENMVRNSFWNIYRPGAYEHYIVHNLRNDESFINNLAYVIEKDDKIIAHINYSNGKIISNVAQMDAVVLGPISVDRDYQNQGYGSKLIEYTLKLIDENDIPFVFVIGDENYYKRFGFESASKYNIFLDGTDRNEECPFFMIKVFDKDILLEGTFYNPDVFNVDENDVDEFDRQFEFKEKLILEGQLGV